MSTIIIGNEIAVSWFCRHGTEAGRSSEVERSLMVRWVVGSILHGVDPLSYFSFQPVLHDWCNKGRGMCYPVCGMVNIKEPLLLIDKSCLCGGSGFPFSLSGEIYLGAVIIKIRKTLCLILTNSVKSV